MHDTGMRETTAFFHLLNVQDRKTLESFKHRVKAAAQGMGNICEHRGNQDSAAFGSTKARRHQRTWNMNADDSKQSTPKKRNESYCERAEKVKQKSSKHHGSPPRCKLWNAAAATARISLLQNPH